MLRTHLCRFAILSVLGVGSSLMMHSQSFSVQCPTTTTLHPKNSTAPGAIKCQQVSGGDGFATMADGNQIFLFGFGPLSGLADIQAGLPGTETAAIFNSTDQPEPRSYDGLRHHGYRGDERREPGSHHGD